MKGPVWPWIVAACGISFGVASWMSNQAKPSATDEGIAAIESRLDTLSRDMEEIRGTFSPAPTSGAGPSPRSGGRMPARASMVSEPSQGELQASYSREPVDSKWAAGAENQLMQMARSDAILSIDASPPTSQRIDCRSTTCKFEFTFPNESDAADWMIAYLTGIGNNLTHTRYFMDRQPDGSMRVTSTDSDSSRAA